MKISFLCPSISRTSGGIFEIEQQLALSLAKLPETTVKIFGPADEHTQADLPSWLPLQPQFFRYRGPNSFCYSAGLRKAFLLEQSDLTHLHALWMYNSILINQWRRQWKKPCLITAHGMLEPWAVKNSAWKKRLALFLYERQNLNGAACIQVNSEAESRSVRDFGLKNPICIIPNGIDVPEVGHAGANAIPHPVPLSGRGGEGAETGSAPWSAMIEPGRKVLLYLGRIHPKKGLVNLLRAWKQTLSSQPSTNGWLLAIAGWDQGGHETELKRLATELGIAWRDTREHSTFNIQHSTPSDFTMQSASPLRLDRGEGRGEVSNSSAIRHPPSSLLFLGPQFNEAKAACYRDCDAFILPSFSEGLPMVVLEAWANAKPVLMTPECNLPEGFAANAAIRIEPNAESIAQGLHQLFRLPSSDLLALGNNGRQLVAARFTWPKVAIEMRSVYDWMMGGGPKPGCVV